MGNLAAISLDASPCHVFPCMRREEMGALSWGARLISPILEKGPAFFFSED
jgi:hypothetical protein